MSRILFQTSMDPSHVGHVVGKLITEGNYAVDVTKKSSALEMLKDGYDVLVADEPQLILDAKAEGVLPKHVVYAITGTTFTEIPGVNVARVESVLVNAPRVGETSGPDRLLYEVNQLIRGRQTSLV